MAEVRERIYNRPIGRTSDIIKSFSLTDIYHCVNRLDKLLDKDYYGSVSNEIRINQWYRNVPFDQLVFFTEMIRGTDDAVYVNKLVKS